MFPYRSHPGERNLTVSVRTHGQARFPEEASMAVDRTGSPLVYECCIYVERLAQREILLRPGVVLGLDVGIADRDGDGSFSWTGWGPRALKFSAAGNVGDLRLVAGPGAVATVTGRVAHPEQNRPDGADRPWPYARVQALDTQGAVLAEARTDIDGRYQMSLLPGEYRITLPDAEHPLSRRIHAVPARRQRVGFLVQRLVTAEVAPPARRAQIALPAGKATARGAGPHAVSGGRGNGMDAARASRWPVFLPVLALGFLGLIAGGLMLMERGLLGNLIASPAVALEACLHRPRWWLPVTALGTGSLLLGVLGVTGAMRSMAGMLQSPSAATAVMLCTVSGTAALLLAVKGAAVWLFRAGGLWAMARVTGDRLPFDRLLSAIGCACVPQFLFGPMAAAAAGGSGRMYLGMVRLPVVGAGPLSLLGLVPELADSGILVRVLAQELDVFSIWSLALTVLAVHRATRWNGERASLLVGTYWVLTIGASAAVAALGPTLGLR